MFKTCVFPESVKDFMLCSVQFSLKIIKSVFLKTCALMLKSGFFEFKLGFYEKVNFLEFINYYKVKNDY